MLLDTVTPSSGNGGNVSPATVQTVNSGATAQFTVTPNSGYGANVAGTCPSGYWNNNTYTTGDYNCQLYSELQFCLDWYQRYRHHDLCQCHPKRPTLSGGRVPRQDAEYGTNSFNFTKLDANGNPLPATATNHSCVQDNITGLMWEVKTADGGLRDKGWIYNNTLYPNTATSDGICQTAGRCNTGTFVADVNAAGLCGYNDWRLPNPQELASIVGYNIASPGPAIDTDYFPNTVSTYFWTMDLYPAMMNTGDSWFFVNFGNGSVGGYSNGGHAIRLVRGVKYVLSFSDNGDGTITDNSTGLMWAKCPLGQTGSNCIGSNDYLDWGTAINTAANSTLAGYSDWRLPNAKELQSIADYPEAISIDSVYFPNTPGVSFWTSSADASTPGNSWLVDFYLGGVYADTHSNYYAVRLVRGGLVLLNTSTAGSGVGTVTSNPQGINCGSTCSASYNSGTVVTLTATPAAGTALAAGAVVVAMVLVVPVA